MSRQNMHVDSDYPEDASTRFSGTSHLIELTNQGMNNNLVERQTSDRKSQLQQITEESFLGYDPQSDTGNEITIQNKPTTAFNVGNVRGELKEMDDDYREGEVVLRSRPRQTEFSNTATLSNKTSDQVRSRFNARNATNLRTNSYSSTQDLRPSSMTEVSSPPNSSSRLRDIRKSLIAETKTLPTLRPLSAGRPISASMVNLSRISSLDFGGNDSGRFSRSSYASRASKTDYPKTRQTNGSPFQVDVLKGIAGIGIKVKVTPNGYAQITDIQRGGPVEKNGQVWVGDNILFVNTTELTGHTDARVQQVLRLLPRGLTKLVVSSAGSSEYQTQTNDQDKFANLHTQQCSEKLSSPESSTVSKEQFSLHPNGNDVLHNKTSLPRFVPSSTAAAAVSTNSSIETVYSNAIETTPTKHLEESNRLAYISRPRHEMLPVEAIQERNNSLKETGEVRSGASTGHDENLISNTRIVDMTIAHTHMPLASQDKRITSSHKPEFDTSLSMSGTQTDTSHSAVLSKSISVGEHHNENAFNDDLDTWNQPPSRSILVSDDIGQSTLSLHKIDYSTFSSDYIDNSTLLFDHIDQSALSPKKNVDSTLSLDIVNQSTFSSNNTNESTVLPNNTDQSTSSLHTFDQSILPSNSPEQSKLVSNNIAQRAKNTAQNANNIMPLTPNEFALNSASASDVELQYIEPPQRPIAPPTKHTPKLYRGMLVTLVDSVDGEETTHTKPGLRMQTGNESSLTKPKAAEPSTVSDYRKTSVSVTPTENYAKVTHNTTSSEQPVPKKRTSLIQNVNTDKSKVINKSLMPLHERRKNASATLPRVPTSQPVTSPLSASRSLSVSTPALNTRKNSSLEPSRRINENTNYQKTSVLSPTPKTTIADFSLDSVSHSRMSSMYASRSISVSNPTFSPKINVPDRSTSVSERANNHNMAVLSPAPLNSALSPRRTPSDSSQTPAFIYPTQLTPTNKDDSSGRLSSGKNRTAEPPRAYKTIQSQLYKAVHPDIYKSASVTLLDKELMSTEHESSYRGQSYDVSHSPHRKTSAATSYYDQSYDVSHPPHRKSSSSSNQTSYSAFNTEAKNKDSENALRKFDVDHQPHRKSFASTSEFNQNYDVTNKSHRFSSTSADRDQSYDVSSKSHRQSSISSDQTRISPFNTEANKEGLENAVTKFDDLLIGSSPGSEEACPDDILLMSSVNDGVSSSMTEDLRAIDNVLLHVYEVKRPIASPRSPRKPKIKEIETDIEAKQSANTNIQITADIALQEQTQDSKSHIVVNQTSDSLSSETPNSNDLTTNMLQEKLVKSNEELIIGIQDECAKVIHEFHQNENVSKHNINNLDDFDKLRQHSYTIVNTSSYSHVDRNPSIINQNASISSDDLPHDHADNRDVSLRAQGVLEESEGITNTQIAQGVNDIVTVNNFTDNRISTMNGVCEDESKVNSLQDDILVYAASQIVNHVMMKIKSNYSILFPNEEVNHVKPLSSEFAEDEPPPLPDAPPPLPDAPPPSLILGGVSTQHWHEQNDASVIPKNSIENNVEKQDDQASSMPQNITVEFIAGQLDDVLHTEELTAASLSDIPSGSQSSKTISNDPRISHADIYHVRGENRGNSPSPIDILSEDSGMPADEDQEMATDDTTSTPGELVDNIFGLDSLKHIPCPSDIEAGLLSSAHEDSNPLLPITLQETDHFVMDPDNDVKIQFYEMSQQSVETLDVFSEDNITSWNLPPPILPVSTLHIAASSTISVEELPTQNSTTLQGAHSQLAAPENTLLATDVSNIEIREVLPPTRVDKAIPKSVSALSDNSLLTHNADVSNHILASSLDVNVPKLRVSESPKSISETVTSNRRWCLRSNASSSPVVAAEAGVSVHARYTETTLTKSLPSDAFIRLLERANVVLDAASASRDLTLLIVHLHRDGDSVPLGVDLKYEGGIWFRVSGIKSGGPVWKEGGASVGDWLLAVDSLWCDNVTVMRFLSRLANPKHDSVLVLCRQHTDLDSTDSRLHEAALPSMKHQTLAHESEHKYSVSSKDREIHSHFSETTEISPSNLISMDVKTAQDQQLLLGDYVPFDHKQSLSLTEKTHGFLHQTPPLLEDTLFLEQKSTLSELALSPHGQTPPLPSQGPPLRGQDSHVQEADSSLQRGASHIPRNDQLLQKEAPDLTEEGPPTQGQAQSPPGRGQPPKGQVLSSLSRGVLLTPNIDHGPLISNETTLFHEQNLSLLQQVPPVSQINKEASSRANYQLQPVQSEQTSQASIRASAMQEESVYSPTFQERSTRYILQQDRVQNVVSSSENATMGRLTTRTTRRFSEEQSQPELRTTQRREYLKTTSRSRSERLSVSTPAEAHTEEQLTTQTIVNSSESTGVPGVGVFKVVITKGATGVGFCLEGGVGSPKGDLPITIKRIFKGGPAEKSGLLKVNDEILEVNGLQFSKMRHYEAWNHLKLLGDGEVNMTIRRI